MNNNNLIVNTNPSIFEKTLPIKIKSVNKALNEEYNLNQECFNPNKSSPPDSWSKRLMERIGNSYEYKHLIAITNKNDNVFFTYL